ncbi:response regulator [Deinococcus sp. VB142]|uniref:Response regulator n=1 Tax=Deinococcus sp. VB142 TaxID=3112952 RepID=A0AAU6Q6W6_9DEIO
MWGAEATDDTQDAAHLAVASSISGPVALRVADFGQIEEVAVTAPNSVLAQLDYLSGMAVSGSGRALPLLDPAGLLRLSRRPERGLGRVSADELSTPRRVLLVDDSLSVRRLVGKMLERGQYHVTTASDGQEALDLLQLDPTYDGVLTDLEMPRLNGYELLSALRTRPDTARLPVLVMTTRAGEKHQRLAFQLGADDYFTKPVNEALLLRRLGSLLAAPRSPETI